MKSEKPTDLLYTLGLTGRRATDAPKERGAEEVADVANTGNKRLGSTCVLLLVHATLGDCDTGLKSGSANASASSGLGGDNREAI